DVWPIDVRIAGVGAVLADVDYVAIVQGTSGFDIEIQKAFDLLLRGKLSQPAKTGEIFNSPAGVDHHIAADDIAEPALQEEFLSTTCEPTRFADAFDAPSEDAFRVVIDSKKR